MKMKKTIIASLFVVCLMVAYLAVIVPVSSEGSSEKVSYIDVDTTLDFTDSATSQSSVATINGYAGDTVCTYDSASRTVTFVKSVSLRCTDPGTAKESNYFMWFNDDGGAINFVVNSGVTVNLKAGASFKGTDEFFGVICSGPKGINLKGAGTLNITLDDIDVTYAAAILYQKAFDSIVSSDGGLTINIEAPNHSGIALHRESTGAGALNLKNTSLTIHAKYALVSHSDGKPINFTFDSDSNFKFVGTSQAIKNGTIGTLTTTLYVSTSYRGVNVEKFSSPDIMKLSKNLDKYQYISTSYVGTSSFLLPLTIIFSVGAIVLFLYVFFHPSRLPWEEAIYQEERAKAKAIKDAAKAEQKKIDDAEKADKARRKAEEKKEADERKAIELKRREEERKVLEQKRADEKAAIQQKKAEERRMAEERKAAELKRRDAERQALEERKAAERKAAEERKAADLKRREAERQAYEQRKAEERAAYEQRKAAERKAAEEKRAADLKRKEAERQAYEQRRAAERKAAEEKRAADLKKREEERAAYEQRKAAERRAAEEKRAEELRRREAERQAYEQRKAEERAKKK